MHAARGRPRTVGEAGDEDAAPRGARDLEAGADGGEDQEALGAGDDLGGYRKQDLGLRTRLARAVLSFGLGGNGLARFGAVAVDAFLCSVGAKVSDMFYWGE